MSTNQIQLPEAPAIPGLAFRTFRGIEDCANIHAILTACDKAEGGERADTLEDVITSYSHLNNCDPYQDLIFAEINGEPIAYTRIEHRREDLTNIRIYLSIGFIKPEWWRKGIGRAMLHWGENRLRQIAASQPEDGPRFFEGFTADNQKGKIALFYAEGYIPVRHFHNMVRPNLESIPDLPLPDGIEVRPAKPEDYRLIWEEMQDAFQDHWGYHRESEENYQHWLASSEFQPDLWQIAWDGPRVVGTVLGYINQAENEANHRKRGYTEEITVLREYRKKGIARALIAGCLRALKAAGMNEAALGVDAENISGATRLYEAMGYRTVSKSSTMRKPLV
ncbi:MAG TPA: GNAT family N-acetyltransferase [Anaerolineaceae bacterium]|nr:GNAT family N-acetyltransferase [Anaerolineaceae bacterium]